MVTIKKVLTLKKMWKIMSELWEWCSENPDQEKWDWPGWEKYGDMHSHCPCCQHVYNEFGKPCNGGDAKVCPAHELWSSGCQDIGSPYHLWRILTTDLDKRSMAAKKISDFAKAKLSKL